MTGVASAAAPRIDLRVLLVTDGSTPVEAIRGALSQAGIPFFALDLRDSGRPVIEDGLLSGSADGVPEARFQAVVLPTDRPAGLSASETTALASFERSFGIRQLDALVDPTPGLGLTRLTEVGDRMLDGRSATLTPEALAGDFGYARGPVPFDDTDSAARESYAVLGVPSPGFQTLLYAQDPATDATGVLAGVTRRDGREELVLTFDYTSDQTQFQMLGPGLIRWLTKGVHLGYDRSYYAVHVDDVLLPNARWSSASNCTWSVDCPATAAPEPDIRMTAADVAYAVDWQAKHNFRIDLAFNGKGVVQAVQKYGTDELTNALFAAKDSFGWINHTWSHRYLGCIQDESQIPWQCARIPWLGNIRYVGKGLLEDEIRQNIDLAAQYRLPINPTELVSGEHSGLVAPPQMPDDNPNMGAALSETGVAVTGSDASLESDQRLVGATRTLPRYPVDAVDYDTATVGEVVDRYNWVHSSVEDGGSGECAKDFTCIAPLDVQTGFQDIVTREAHTELGHILTNDPRPHYAHESNMAEDRTLYPILERAIGSYEEMFAENRPLLIPTMTESADLLTERTGYLDALAAGRVTSWLQDGVITVSAPTSTPVPLTAPEGTRTDGPAGSDFGQPYGGERSAWSVVTGQVQYALPGTQSGRS